MGLPRIIANMTPARNCVAVGGGMERFVRGSIPTPGTLHIDRICYNIRMSEEGHVDKEPKKSKNLTGFIKKIFVRNRKPPISLPPKEIEERQADEENSKKQEAKIQ